MTEVFEGYERQYCELSTNLSRKCTSAVFNGEENKQKLGELKAGLDATESLIRRMDLEARILPPTQKATLLAKVREYKSDLNMLKREVKKLARSSDPHSAKDDLESGLLDQNAPGPTVEQSQSRLMMSTDRLHQSGEKIKESKRQILETEDLGVQILQDLHIQHQTLLHTQNTARGVDDSIATSRQMLSSMSHRMDRHKWITGIIIVVLMLAIMLIIYVKTHK